MISIEMAYSNDKDEYFSSISIDFSTGRNVLSISSAEPLVMQENWQQDIELEVCWAEKFQGSSAKYSVRFNEIPVTSGLVNKFGNTIVRFSLKLQEFPIVLQWFFEIQTVSKDVPLNAPNFYKSPASISRISLKSSLNDFRSRLHLMRLARDAAMSMQLIGVYMDDRKTDSLRKDISHALERKIGYCVIRLGDGEGRVLGYPDLLSAQELLYQVLYYHFGPISMNEFRELNGADWIDNVVYKLKELLKESLQSADRVGFPVADFFDQDESKWGYGQIGYAGAMTYLNAYHERPKAREPLGTNVFQQLAKRNDFFGPVSRLADRVYTVGPWDLTRELAEALGLRSIEHVQVQRHFTWSEEKSWGQFPYLYEVTMQHINSLGDLRGCLFLVGAGLPGKAFCAAVKRQGGVALDIGSVFDTWARKGIPYAVENSKFFDLSDLYYSNSTDTVHPTD